MTQPIIQTTDLTHRYGDFVAVRDLNLTVEQGEIFGFLGPNGAGKTTTIRTLLDFIRPSAGSASLFGLDSVHDSVAIRKRVGYLPSELKIWENWTGVQYIRWLEDVHRRECLPEARRLADRLDYDLERSLAGLSTGMRRKMGVIAALAHQPELLILDEPTTGLDPLMQQAFHEIALDVREQGRTVFLSSHNLPEVEQICDRVGIIRQGELEAVETVANLTRLTFRWLTLTLAEPPERNGFSHIQGVSELEVDGNEVRMKIGGDTDMDAVIKAAAQHTVQDIALQRPTLEEIFLAYYGQQEVARNDDAA